MMVNENARQAALPPPASRIKLVVSDMDGTLLTPEKQVTHHSIAAIKALKEAGVPVCLVSSRPPNGMEMYFEVLGIDTPYGALNGGTIFNADRSIRSQLSLDPEAVQEALDMLKVHGCSVAMNGWWKTKQGLTWSPKNAPFTCSRILCPRSPAP